MLIFHSYVKLPEGNSSTRNRKGSTSGNSVRLASPSPSPLSSSSSSAAASSSHHPTAYFLLYIYIYIYIYIYTYVYIYTNTYIYKYTHVYLDIHILYLCVNVNLYIYIDIDIPLIKRNITPGSLWASGASTRVWNFSGVCGTGGLQTLEGRHRERKGWNFFDMSPVETFFGYPLAI